MNNAIAGMVIGGTTGAALLAADLVTASNLNLRDALTLVVFVSTLVWWMGRKFQSLEDKLKDHTERLKNLPCRRDKANEQCEEEKP